MGVPTSLQCGLLQARSFVPWRPLDGDAMTASRKKKEDARKRPLSPGWCVAWEITPYELLLFLLRNGESGLLEGSVAEYEC